MNSFRFLLALPCCWCWGLSRPLGTLLLFLARGVAVVEVGVARLEVTTCTRDVNEI